MSIKRKLQRLGLVLLGASILISAGGCGKKNPSGFGKLENNLRETIGEAINKAVPKTGRAFC